MRLLRQVLTDKTEDPGVAVGNSQRIGLEKTGRIPPAEPLTAPKRRIPDEIIGKPCRLVEAERTQGGFQATNHRYSLESAAPVSREKIMRQADRR